MAAKILVADDATSIVTLVKATLEAKGYAVVAAYDGREALRMVEIHKPDLVILDIMMPKVDGLEVRKKLLDDPKTKDLPVIHLSAVGDFNTQHEAIAGGYTDYMVKPFTPAELAKRVREILDAPVPAPPPSR
jgi:DNA-binding response OmpR family regulator